jgi:hypothetical protein
MRTSKTMIIGGPAVASLEDLPRRLEFLAGSADSIQTRARWHGDGKNLILTTEMNLATSQGYFPFTSDFEYSLSTDGMTLTVTETRPTRTSKTPRTIFVYNRVL